MTLTCVQYENRLLWMSEAPFIHSESNTFFAEGIWISFQWKLLMLWRQKVTVRFNVILSREKILIQWIFFEILPTFLSHWMLRH